VVEVVAAVWVGELRQEQVAVPCALLALCGRMHFLCALLAWCGVLGAGESARDLFMAAQQQRRQGDHRGALQSLQGIPMHEPGPTAVRHSIA
jgi:hypothetical protein